MTEQPTKKRIPRSVWLRVAAWAAIIAVGFALVRWTPLGDLLTEERLKSLATELRGTWWAPLALIGLFASLAPTGLLMSPLIVAGAVFGPFYGTVYNTIGLVLGALSSYFVARLLGRELVVRVAGKRLQRAEKLLERYAFWPLVHMRFLPIPFAVANFAAALAGVRLPLFLSTAVVGLIPSTLVHTYFIARLMEPGESQRTTTGAIYLAVLVAFNIALSIPSLLAARSGSSKP